MVDSSIFDYVHYFKHFLFRGKHLGEIEVFTSLS